MTTKQPTSVEKARKSQVFSPAVDIEEGRDDLVVWADLPGVSEDDLHITLEKNVLTIEAKTRIEEWPSHQVAHREYHEGDFRRVFTITDAIERDGIRATLKDGVLRLVLPKSEPAKPRTIEVRSV